MDDIFDMNPMAGEPSAETEQAAEPTIAMPPVEAAPQGGGRRRRTERNVASYEQAAAIAAAAAENGGEVPQEALEKLEEEKPAEPAEPAPQENAGGETRQVPVSPLGVKRAEPQSEGGTTAVPRFQTRYNPPVPGSIPSQGVPRPSSLNQNAPRRPVFTAGLGEVRRPVQAEGYVPARPLGVNRAERPEPVRRPLNHPEAVQPVPMQQLQPTRRPAVPTLDDGEEYEDEGRKNVLPIVVIVLLVIAALVLGLLLIPEDMGGPLGSIKRGVTGLFGGQTDKAPAQALGFTGEVNKDTAPYQITFHVTTTTNVTDVRVMNERGEVMNTTLTASIPNTDNMLHVLTMPLESEYEGYIYLQIFDGEEWIDTELKQQLSIGADRKLKISDTSSTTLTAGSTAAVTANTTLTAGSATEPTVSPAVEETDAPLSGDAPQVSEPVAVTDAPEATATAEPTATVTATPTPAVTATPTAEPTPTPTMALTPTPTVRVTATPTAEPTPEPTAEPTPEPTAVPTATPVPTPEPTAKLEASAGEGASPKLIYTQRIFKAGRRLESYARAEKNIINMPAGDDYLTVDFGVTTFRGNAFRMNASSGNVENPTSMSVLWQTPGGKLQIKSGWRYGFGVYSQPAIIKWTKDVRSMMPLNEGYADKRALKEVIIAGQDGKIYFLDLETGEPTREAIDIGYALRGAPSIHPLGYPVLTVGQFSNKLPSKTSKTMGLYYFNLADNKQLRLINTLDEDAYYTVGAMDTSALFDRNSNTLIAIGTNGMLYTEKLNMQLIMGESGNVFLFGDVEDSVALVSYTKNQKNSYAAVESSLAMYGSYAFYADMDGILRCVDTTGMTTVWAVDTGDAVRAAVALDLEEESGTLWLYTANTITNRSKNGEVTIRRYNAMTGELSWELPVHCIRKYTGQKDATGKDITAGAVASPVIGQHALGNMVYFTLSSVSDTGYESLTGEAAKQPSVLIAIDKSTGEVVWTKSMDAYSYSSPVAVYNEAGDGWIIQCCSNGTVYLLNGMTGETVSTLAVPGVIEGSPAVYNDVLVFGTTGNDKNSFVYGIRLK